MNRLVTSRNIYLLLLFHTFTHLYGQNLIVRKYTLEDGLKSNVIFDIAQEKNGRIWISTENGISSYNGKNWTSHIEHILPPLIEYTHLSIDELNRIWSSPIDLAFDLKMYDGNKWSSINVNAKKEFPDFNITSLETLVKDGTTKIFIGTEAGLIVRTNNVNKLLTVKDGLPGNYINSISKHEGKIFIATDKGITFLNGDKLDYSLNTIVPSQYRDILALHIVTDSNGNNKNSYSIYFITKNIIGKIDAYKKFHFIADIRNKLIEYQKLRSIQYDGIDRIYFGNEGLKYYYQLSTRKITALTPYNGFVKSGANKILIDKEQNVWFATYRGVEKISSPAFQNYYTKHGLLEDEVSAIEERSPNSYVLGHNDGLTFLNNSGVSSINFANGNDYSRTLRRIISACSDLQGNVYIAASTYGVGKIDRNYNLSWYPNPTGESFVTVARDHKGNIWTNNSFSVYKLEGIRLVKKIELEKTLINIRKICFSKDDKLFIVTRKGLIIFSGKNFNLRESYISKEYENLYCATDLGNDTILLGSTNGLYQLVNGKLTKYKCNGVEITDKVFSILEDHDGNLWFGTNVGVLRWSKNKLDRFSQENGLAGRETNRGALICDSFGNIWIGTESGLSRYNSKYDFGNPSPKYVEFNIENNFVSRSKFTSEIQFPYNQRDLTIEVNAISFINEKEISYKAKLEGFEDQWIEYGKDNRLRFTNLPPGEYRLLVQTKNYTGEWSPVFSSPNFLIANPFYRTWWFTINLLIILFVLIRMFLKYFTQIQYSKNLEDEVHKRTNELKESSSKLSSLLHNAPNYILSADRSGIVTFVNNTLKNNTRMNIVGRSILDFIPFDQASEVKQKFLRVFEEKESQDFTHGFITTDGDHRFLHSYVSPLIIDDIVNEAIIISYDVTELKMLEERQSNILEKVPVILYSSNLNSDYAATWISDNVYSLTGYSKDKFLTEKYFWGSNLHPDDRESVMSIFKDIKINKEMEVEYRWKCAGGNYKWFIDFVIPKSVSAQGEIEYLGMWFDITDRKAALIRLENLNDVMLSFSADPEENINKLTKLCCQELNASFVIYTKLIQNQWHLISSWNKPSSFDICSDNNLFILKEPLFIKSKEPVHIDDISTSSNEVLKEKFVEYNLKAFVSSSIIFNEEQIGQFCIFFSNTTHMGEADLKLIGIISAAIAIEEERS